MSLLFTAHWPKLVRWVLPSSLGTQSEPNVSPGDADQLGRLGSESMLLVTMPGHLINHEPLEVRFPL